MKEVHAEACFFYRRGSFEGSFNAAEAACQPVSDDSDAALFCAEMVAKAVSDTEEPDRAEQVEQAGLLREIIGNPFRPVVLNAAWLTSTVCALASGIYSDRAFDRMPILADALQDAGCDNEEVLGHCRGPGPHARGCFVVDCLLGKK